MVLFERFIYVVAGYTLVAPLVPWVFAWWRGKQAVWPSTGLALVVLLVLHLLLWPACVAANCGQGAVIVPPLWALGAISGLASLGVGWLIARVKR